MKPLSLCDKNFLMRLFISIRFVDTIFLKTERMTIVHN